MLYIKESYVYDLDGWTMHCHVDGCGYWRDGEDHSNGRHPLLRMFKVNGAYTCEACLEETAYAIHEWLEEEE